ncbi:MAG TPA: winged helix DNA-binding domain-containing protein [Gemmatimonadaceae bacterium]|nr:winged helix DNA-binding domain-containing protein [Gemmatimonadaceae bacterium]
MATPKSVAKSTPSPKPASDSKANSGSKRAPVRTPAPVLKTRALNRATLARQLLLRRVEMPVLEAIEQVIGLQAQLPNPPYVGLWTRLAGFDKKALTRLIEKRRVVRSTMMRATQHLVTARDYLQLRPVLQPVITRSWRSNWAKKTAGLDAEELLEAARALLTTNAHTLTELQSMLGARWPKHDPHALAYTVQLLLPLVHVPPRGTWGRGGAVPATLAESWLRRPMSTDASPEELIVRYLGAFGPASVADVQMWSGLTGLRTPIEALRSQLRIFRDETGKELFDVPDGPLPDADTPVRPLFLPEYDNTLLAHADRTRVVSDANRKRIWTTNGALASLLVDGVVAGRWKIVRERTSAILEIEAFGRLAKIDRAAVAEEGMRLLAFTDGDDVSHDVRWITSA